MNFGSFKLGTLLVAVFVVGVSGTYFGMQQNFDSNALVTSTSGHMLGHVTVTVIEPDGNINAYRQSDNAIVELGMEMIAAQMFEGVNGTGNNMDLALTNRAGGVNPIDAIGIGTGSDPAWGQDTTIAFNGCNNVTTSGINFGTVFGVNNDNKWVMQTSNGTGGTTHKGAGMIGINGSATFGPTVPTSSCNGLYTEAGAFDNDTSGAMFARNTYAAVSLTPVDQLVINWNFQFDDS